jgi:hypothetical protein
MTRSSLALAIAAAIAVLVAAAGAAEAQVLSPGPLHAAHADIDGDENCGKCHASGKKVDDARCLSCHSELDRRIKASAGLHGASYKGQECSRCHIEHLGRKSRLVRWPGGDMNKLDHKLAGWPLEGKHAQIACVDCHKTRTKRGSTTFLGLPVSCVSCHKDPHGGSMGAGCASCHNATSWKDVRVETFDHDKAAFRLLGKHKQVDCKACHGEPPKYKGLAFGLCSDCHKDPHEGRFERKACTDCHSEAGWEDHAKIARKHPGVRLSGGHRPVKCERCHDRGNDRSPSKGDDCVDCHAPVHEAKFGRDCAKCHKQIEWLGLPKQIGLEHHDETAYPLVGKHVAVDCVKCHPTSLPPRKRFRELTFDRCVGCHADRHGGEFAARGGGECSPCHTERGFLPTSFGVTQHATTTFALEGRHAAVPCGQCHVTPRPRLDLRVVTQACADCHPNPHGEEFAKEMAQGGCAVCHTADSWHQAKIDHSIWPLTGAHQRTACARCHGEAARGDVEKFRGVPRDCEGCHEDVHAGQFRLNEPVRACEACHATETFAIASFDHAKLASWPLDGKHAKVACEKCHPDEKLANGREAVRWRLGYRTCRACHANPHTEERKR